MAVKHQAMSPYGQMVNPTALTLGAKNPFGPRPGTSLNMKALGNAPNAARITEITERPVPYGRVDFQNKRLGIEGQRSPSTRELVMRQPQTELNQGDQYIPPRPQGSEVPKPRTLTPLTVAKNIAVEAKNTLKREAARAFLETGKAISRSVLDLQLSGSAPSLIERGKAISGAVMNLKAGGDAPEQVQLFPDAASQLLHKVAGDVPEGSVGGNGVGMSAAQQDNVAARSISETTFTAILGLIKATIAFQDSGFTSEYNSLLQLWQELARNYSRLSGQYNNNSIDLIVPKSGSSMLIGRWGYVRNPQETTDPVENWVTATLIGYCWQVGVLQTQGTSVPLMPTVDFTTLITSASGGSATQYSSALRLNLSVFKADSLAWLATHVFDMIYTRSGYSFVRRLFKYLLTVQTLSPLPGTEAGEWFSGLGWQYDHTVRQHVRERGYPYTPTPGQGAVQRIKLRIVDYSNYVLESAARPNTTWANGWGREYWSNKGFMTVVMDTTVDTNPLQTTLRILHSGSYPFWDECFTTTAYGQSFNADTPGWVDVTFPKDGRPTFTGWSWMLCPPSNCVFVGGAEPVAEGQGNIYEIKCLIVVKNSTTSNDLSVKIYTDNWDNEVTINSATYNPGAGVIQHESFIMPGTLGELMYREKSKILQGLQDEITAWESTFGTDTERTIAMAMASNFSCAWGPTKAYVRAQPNTNQQDWTNAWILNLPNENNAAEWNWPPYWTNDAMMTQDGEPGDYSLFRATKSSLYLTTDCLGLFPFKTELGTEVMPRAIGPYSHYLLEKENPLIELAVHIGLVTVSGGEEYSQTLVGTNALVAAMTMRKVGVLQALGSDNLHQTMNVTWIEKVFDVTADPFPVAGEGGNRMATQMRLRRSDGFVGALELLIMGTAQFGAVGVDEVSPSRNVETQDAGVALYTGRAAAAYMFMAPFVRAPHWHLDMIYPKYTCTNNIIALNTDSARFAVSLLTFDDLQHQEPEVRRPFDIWPTRLSEALIGEKVNYLANSMKFTLAEFPSAGVTNNVYVYLAFPKRNFWNVSLVYAWYPPDMSQIYFMALSSANNNVTIVPDASFQALPLRYILPNASIKANEPDVCLCVAAGADNNLKVGASGMFRVLTVPENIADTVTTAYPDVPSFRTFTRSIADTFDN
jgi:hypothetical protein